MKVLKINKAGAKISFVALLFLAAALIVVGILPKTPRIKQEYRIGAPWHHEDLYAQFDFPIYKSESELFAEKANIKSSASPLFRISLRESAIMMNTLKELNKPSTLKVTDEAYSDLLADIETSLKYIYSKGIISESDVVAMKLGKDANITVLRDNIAELTPIGETFTADKANAYIVNSIATNLLDGNAVKAKNIVRELDIDNYIKPNLAFDKKASSQHLQDLQNDISLTSGLVLAGQKIISKGEIVNEKNYKVLESLKQEYSSRFSYSKNIYYLAIGQFLIVAGTFLMLFLFLYHYRREVLESYSSTNFILLSIVGMVALTAWFVRMPNVSLLLLPAVISPMFVRMFFDSRIAFFSYNVILILGAFLAPNSFEFILINFFPGVVAILTMKHIDRTGKIFGSMLVVYATYIMVYLAIALLRDTKLDTSILRDIMWLGANSLMVLAAFQFAYIIERLFGFLSDATLRELNDTNRSLLKELSEVVPGTFQHSLQVANLAEAAAREIGANPLLIRTGALYHDIGKMNNPGYFTENQSGNFNPHRNLDLDESAGVIIRHVTDGIQIARKHGLHNKIIQFIKTHHGTTKVNYFYKQYLENSKEQNIDERFTYLGPKPETKEEALLMLADSIEAASRSLKVYTVDNISKIVEEIVKNKLHDGQLDKADITFGELTIAIETFKRKLLNIYHSRVEYPE